MCVIGPSHAHIADRASPAARYAGTTRRSPPVRRQAGQAHALSLGVATLRRMPQPDIPVQRPPAPNAVDYFAPDADLPEHGVTLLADLVAACLGLFVTALALLTACGWLTTLWGAVLLGALLTFPLVLVLVVLIRR